MTKLAFETFLDDVMPELPGCENALALFHIKRAVNDFGRISRFLRKTLPVINVVAGTATYAVTMDDPDLQLIEPSQVWYAQDLITKATPAQLGSKYRNWRTDQGTVERYTRLDSKTITLIAVPDTSLTGGLEIEVFYAPDFAAAGGFDAELYNLYADEIAAGAKARLMKMARKPWSNPGQAATYELDFTRGANTAKQQALLSFTGASSRSTTHYR